MKNFIVKAKPVRNEDRGVANLLRYLNNAKEESHKNTDIIVFTDNKTEFKKRCIMNAHELYLQNKKGGRRVKTFAQSFSFNLPKTIDCNVEKWKAIEEEMSAHVCSYLGIERTDFYSNLHKEKFKNSHLNYMISKVVFNKETKLYRSLYHLDRLNFVYSLKCKFNDLVKKHCNFAVEDYIPENKTNPAVQEFGYMQAVGLPAITAQVDQLVEKKTALEGSIRASEARKLDLDTKIALTRENAEKELLKSQNLIHAYNSKLRKKQSLLREKDRALQELSNNKVIRFLKAILKSTEVEDLRKMVYQLEAENKKLVELKYVKSSDDEESIKQLKIQLKQLKLENSELKEDKKMEAFQKSVASELDLKIN